MEAYRQDFEPKFRVFELTSLDNKHLASDFCWHLNVNTQNWVKYTAKGLLQQSWILPWEIATTDWPNNLQIHSTSTIPPKFVQPITNCILEFLIKCQNYHIHTRSSQSKTFFQNISYSLHSVTRPAGISQSKTTKVILGHSASCSSTDVK